MTKNKSHPYLPKLCNLFEEKRVDRREFLRTATLLGMSAAAAYGVAGMALPTRARAAATPSGTLRLAMHVQDVKIPHTISWVEASNLVRPVCEYLSRTDQDNVTTPYLLENWEPNDDLTVWTLKLREGIKWHSGRPFTTEDAIWNIKRVLDPETGSSVLGLMKGYLLEEYETGAVDSEGNKAMSTRLWDANAIEKVDDLTFRLNLKTPQLAVPEHFFHYPFYMLSPEDNGEFGMGADGTGPFKLMQYDVGARAILEANPDYWGEGPLLAKLDFIDLGDDAMAPLSALASGQVDGVYEVDEATIDAYKQIDGVEIYSAVTAQTGVARMRLTEKPFDDPRVRKAIRLASDCSAVLEIVFRGSGGVGENHHVCQIHPEYAKLPPVPRDIAKAKALLAEAGYPDGLELEIAAKNNPLWEGNVVQVLVEQWRDAGINCKINMMPSAQYWDVWTKVPFGYTSWAHRPLGVMVLALAYRSGVPWNESAYSNAKFDELLAKAEATYDVEARRAIMAELETIMQEDGPIVQPIWRQVQTAYSTKVKGFREHPTQYIFFEELSIEG